MGEWVKFPTTAEELKEVFKRIGIGQKDDFGQPYEEWFITDYAYFHIQTCEDRVTVKPSIMMFGSMQSHQHQRVLLHRKM